MIEGSIVALVTPMREDESIDYETLARLIDFHVREGSKALVVAGTSGEASTLTFAEHCELIAFAVRAADGRLPVIGGTGSNNTAEAIELTEAAARAGVAACLLVAPYYVKPTQEGLYRHHRRVAEAVDIPQILYNVPGRTAVDLHDDTVVRLAAVDNIIGLKDATGDIPRLRSLLPRLPAEFPVYSGDDATTRAALLAGARGAISVTANVAPAAMAAMCEAAMAGDAQRAAELDAPLAGLHRTLFLETNPIPVKWAVHRRGLIGETLRLPLTPLSETCRAPLEQAMRSAGVL